MTPTPSSKPPGAFEPLTGIRMFFAIVGLLIMTFAGGCALIFLIPNLLDSPGQALQWIPAILVFGGPPFLVGLLIRWLAMRAGRRRIQ